MIKIPVLFVFILVSINSIAQQTNEKVIVFEATTYQLYSWDGNQYTSTTPKQNAGYKIYWYGNELTTSGAEGMTIIGTDNSIETYDGYDSDKGYSYGDFNFNGKYTKTGQDVLVRIRFYKDLSLWYIQLNIGNTAIKFEGNFKKVFVRG